MSLSSSLAEAARVTQDQKRKGLVRAEQVRLLYTNANVGIWVTVIVAPILGYLEARIAQAAIQAWLLYMLAVSAARFALARLYWRSSTVSTRTDTWGATFAVGAGLSGLGWGAASALLYTEADLMSQVILAFVLGGMMLGAAFLLAPRPAAFVAFIIPIGFSLSARFLLQADKVHVAMGLLATLFTIVTLITTWRLHLTVGSSLKLRFENRDLVEAQDALLESEERFRSLFENATVGIYRTTPEGHILMANPVLLSMLGCESFEEMSRRNLEEEGFEPGYSRSAFRKLLEAEGIVRGIEAAWTRRDGSVLFVRESARAVCGADGSILYYDGIVEDFTQRKRAEDTLRESEERFRAIFHQAAVGVAQANAEGEVTMVNDRYCKIFDYKREELLATKLLLDKTHPDDRVTVLSNQCRLLKGEIQSYSIEVRCARADGDTTWISLYESLVREGRRPKYFVAVIEDITKRRQAEAALQESEERFRNMADTAPVMIWVTGPDKLFTFFNRTWLDFTGRTMEQELGNGWAGGVHPDDLDRCNETFCSSFEARRNFHIECRLRRADGEYRWVLCTGVPRFGPGGVFAGYIGSDIDLTDLRRAQEETLARQKLESLGVLAGGIAHDFNNLLGGILINAELALTGLPLGSSAYAGLETIKNVAVRATEIVRQMMAYAGQEDTAFEAVNVSRLVGDMLQLLKVSISKTAILEVNLPENVPAVRGNAAQIRQVVMNLITNASEALGEKEGAICVSVTQVQLGPDSRAQNLSQGDYVRLEVSDTGCGMTEEILGRIFDPFFTTKFTGRGLGLAAVQGIVRNHGGVINVTSAPGQGCRFEVLLPSAGQAVPSTTESTVRAARGEVGSLTRTILVIEDEEVLCLAVSKMLRRKGLTVIEAASGKTGIDLFRVNAQQIDVVLLDLTLPGLSGGDVLRELRRIQPDIKVIVTSAYSQDWVLEAIAGKEPWFYVRKPYQFSELVDIVRIVCMDKVSGRAHG
jgi:PAS domain S-box-containing protein